MREGKEAGMGELCGSTWCPACRRPARDGAEREELCRLLGYSVDVGDRDLYAHAAREVTRLRRFLETEIDVTAEVCSLSGESRGVLASGVCAPRRLRDGNIRPMLHRCGLSVLGS